MISIGALEIRRAGLPWTHAVITDAGVAAETGYAIRVHGAVTAQGYVLGADSRSFVAVGPVYALLIYGTGSSDATQGSAGSSSTVVAISAVSVYDADIATSGVLDADIALAVVTVDAVRVSDTRAASRYVRSAGTCGAMVAICAVRVVNAV